MRNIVSVFIDSVLTRRCPGCGNPIDIFEENDICAECLPGFEDISDKIFYVSDIEMMKACYLFSGPPRHGLHRFKYRNDGSAGIFYARKMADMIKNESFIVRNGADLKNDFVIVPVPGNVKDTVREYVQAEFLAKRISHILGIPYVKDAVRKKRSAVSQTKCRDRIARKKNAEKSFTVNNKSSCEKLKGKTVFLIDDISTTGATLSAVGKILKKFGVKSVYGVCAAKTPSIRERKGKYLIPNPPNKKLIQVDVSEFENI